MGNLRPAATIILAVTLCLVGGSEVNAGRPRTPVPVAAPKSVPAGVLAAGNHRPAPANGRGTPAPPGDQTSPTASRNSAVGALFTMGDKGLVDHFCTASVVHSAHRNLVITAAHCLHSGPNGDYGGNIVFVPGYHDGVTPYGIWPAERIVVDPRWIESGDPDLDVGFLTVAQAGNPLPVEDVTGGNAIATGRGYALSVTLIGYPNDTDEPLTCSNTSNRQSRNQLRLDCAGFAPGTSGSPWLVDVDPRSQRGVIAGVIGGYQQGGLDPDVSYSSYFGNAIADLYDAARHAG